MRSFIRAAALTSTIILAGCAGIGPAPLPPVPPPTATVTDVISAVARACDFIPDAASIIALISANPTWTTVGRFVGPICNAVVATVGGRKAARRGGAIILINVQGVIIEGVMR